MITSEALPIWKSLPTKLQAYKAVYRFNRSFEAALLSLERLEHLGLFRLENLNEYKIRLEYTRAIANEELINTLQEYEMEESTRFEEMQRSWENQGKDLDDVFFDARNRKQEIKEQMKELQRGLERERPRHGKAKRKKTTR